MTRSKNNNSFIFLFNFEFSILSSFSWILSLFEKSYNSIELITFKVNLSIKSLPDLLFSVVLIKIKAKITKISKKNKNIFNFGLIKISRKIKLKFI